MFTVEAEVVRRHTIFAPLLDCYLEMSFLINVFFKFKWYCTPFKYNITVTWQDTRVSTVDQVGNSSFAFPSLFGSDKIHYFDFVQHSF